MADNKYELYESLDRNNTSLQESVDALLSKANQAIALSKKKNTKKNVIVTIITLFVAAFVAFLVIAIMPTQLGWNVETEPVILTKDSVGDIIYEDDDIRIKVNGFESETLNEWLTDCSINISVENEKQDKALGLLFVVRKVDEKQWDTVDYENEKDSFDTRCKVLMHGQTEIKQKIIMLDTYEGNEFDFYDKIEGEIMCEFGNVKEADEFKSSYDLKSIKIPIVVKRECWSK